MPEKPDHPLRRTTFRQVLEGWKQLWVAGGDQHLQLYGSGTVGKIPEGTFHGFHGLPVEPNGCLVALSLLGMPVLVLADLLLELVQVGPSFQCVVVRLGAALQLGLERLDSQFFSKAIWSLSLSVVRWAS